MIETWVFLLGIFATALVCFVGGFAYGLLRGWKELQKDIEEKAITTKHGDMVFVCLDYILEIIDKFEKKPVRYKDSVYVIDGDELWNAIKLHLTTEIMKLRGEKE